MIEEFAGRVALVTGAGRNIGRAIALQYAERGAHVVVAVRGNVEEGRAVALEATKFGVDAISVVGDVADPEHCRKLAATAEERFGHVDFLVHAVGLRPHAKLLDVSHETWHAVIETNCSAAFYLAQAVLPSMAERRFGRIIGLGGVRPGRAALKKHGHISVSKAALDALIKEIAVEFGADGITANLVVPGPMDVQRKNALSASPADRFAQLAIPRLGDPEEVANACMFLSSDQAGFITGQTIRVNGGLEM
ncbi:SDR family NAD(P)-dependent oxidoreductase [Amycolatopsis sp. GM8]|uniref:SDR family NAD(P)-dependent oxidoreductase n=1 Tax=Amycolatopsis sp. GM8 TaxID=2896530 RepID=UPI001F2A9EE1|nr:SDR family oxidoreductase [Amycolatopsis sp. GM8]